MARETRATDKALRSRRRKARRGWLVLALLLVLLLLPVLGARFGLLKGVVLARLESMLGAEMSAARLVIEPGGRIVADGVRVRTPGVPGPASNLFEADRVEVQATWGDLLSGKVEELVLTRPRLRVSRDAETGQINLSELKVPTSDGGDVVTPPRLVVREGVIELGEHRGESFELLRALRVEGSARPSEDREAGGYELVFNEGSVSEPGGAGLGLTGLITPDGVSLQLDGLDFARWGPDNIPSQFREVFTLMRMEGGIPRASLVVEADGSTTGVVELDGVSLNLPFDAEGRAAEPEEMVRLRDVTGRIEVSDDGAAATLRGQLGDLPSTVRLRYNGLSEISPFVCEIDIDDFQLSSNPELLPLAPGVVRRRLGDFSNPTATLDAKVRIERGEPHDGEAGRIEVAGEIAFRDGTASYRKFPYPFQNLRGLARFDEEMIEIVGIEGRSASGATVRASGTITPPRSGAAVELRIEIDDVPIDPTLMGALDERRREVIEAVCHEPSYDRLRELGLVRAPGEEGPGQEFALGGVASVSIQINRELGEDSDYTKQVEVRLPRVGLTPEPFPMPIVGRDVVLTIDEDLARVTSGRFTGLSGGEGTIDATVDLDKPDASGLQLRIDAGSVPVDPYLLAALPGGLDEETDDRSPSALLGRLGVRGLVECVAHVAAREDGELGYDIAVAFDGVEASPVHGETDAEPVELLGFAGELQVSEREVRVRAAGGVRGREEPSGPAGRVDLDATVQMGDAPRFATEVEAELPDVGIAVEDLVAVVAPEFAREIVELRRERNPDGAIGISLVAAGEAAEGGAVETLIVTARSRDRLAFDAEAGRLELTGGSGAVRVEPLSLQEAVFEDWSAAASLEGETPAELRVSGVLPLERDWNVGDRLSLGVRGVRLRSALVRSVTDGVLPPVLASAIDAADVRSLFDADLELTGARGRERPLIVGEIRPERMELTLAEQRVTLEAIDGSLVLEPGGGRFDSVRARGNGWWADVNGTWATAGEGAVVLEGTVEGRSEAGLTPEVRALLPTGLREALDALSLEASGPVEASGIALRLSLNDQGGSAHAASGRVGFAGASAVVGVGVTEASGYLDFESQSEPGGEMSNFGVGVVVDRALAAGIEIADGRMRVTSDPMSRTVLVPALRADVHGGRLSGSAVLHAGERATYEAEFRLSGAPMGELLADWEHAAGVELARVRREEAPERPEAEARGMVDAGLTLAGELAKTQTRRGRGRVTVGGGEGTRVLRLPLLLPLIEVSNLQVPRNDPLDFGEAVFILDGDRVVFERVGVFAESVEIFGYGQMKLPSLELDLRFNSRAAARVPVLSDLVERFRDELITTKVEGTLAEPEISTEQFTGTRRALSGLLGGGLSEEERRMLEIERLSREAERREWRSPGRSGSDGTQGR